ncbi:MAG: AraC family transcriptional regulator [Algisphaera sp.]
MLPKLEHISRADDASFAYHRHATALGWPYKWHFHPEIELTLILQGEGQRYVGNSIETFAPGDLVLLGANLPHAWHSRQAPTTPQKKPPSNVERGIEIKKNCSCSAVSEAVVIQFSAEKLMGPLVDLPEAAPLRKLLEHARRGLVFPPSHRKIDQHMIALAERHGWSRVVALLDLLGELAAEPNAGRALSDAAHAVPPRRDDQHRIDVVCRLLAEGYTQHLDQTQAAQTIHLSPSSFSRFFKRMTGRTFVAYLHELRIADACRRLTESDRRITDICFDCGFENISNFNRVFRRLRGVSPRDYRQQRLL